MEENLRIILIDSRAPNEALRKLASFGKLFMLQSQGITYDAISCHPDIFVFQSSSALILAPNAPGDLHQLLVNEGIPFSTGIKDVGKNYPGSAAYNAFADENILVYCEKITDKSILQASQGLKQLAVKQGYIRCNLVSPAAGVYITSDRGIDKVLNANGFESHYFSPKGILLPGFHHGFLGGCMGFYQNTLFINGSLHYYPDADRLLELLHNKQIRFLELHEGELFDGGGLFFLKHLLKKDN